jgi:hypothetical protein
MCSLLRVRTQVDPTPLAGSQSSSSSKRIVSWDQSHDLAAWNCMPGVGERTRVHLRAPDRVQKQRTAVLNEQSEE